MGIRINCPNCQKQMNVKSFLAGKRGVCPDCGTKFEIPIGGEHNVVLEVEESESTFAARKTDLLREQESMPPAGMPPMPGAAPVFPSAMPVAPVAQSVQPYAMPTVPAAYGQGHPQVMPMGVAPNPAQPINPAQPLIAQPLAALPGMPAVPQGRPDPIAQSPQLPWHICAPSGDQYGPVLGDVLRQWVADGRITPDSLLWREGWSDWQRADAVLLEFTPAVAPPAVAMAAPAPLADPGVFPGAVTVESPFPTEPARITTMRVYGKRSNNTQAVMITLLIIALLILAPLLGYVLVRQL